MLYCSNCDIKYPADDGQAFCDKCGGPVQPLQEQSIAPAPISDVSLERSTAVQSGADELPMRVTDQSNTQSSSPTNLDIGDKVTNVYNGVTSQDYCIYGGERVYQDKSFRCPECGRDPICTDNFD